MSLLVLKYNIMLFLGIIIVFSTCQKKLGEDEVFAKVGGKIISQKSFEAFKEMKYNYPADLRETFFPGDRKMPTICVETEVLYKTAGFIKKDLKKSNDWKWKEIFFPAQLYMTKILVTNLGYSQKQVESYYNKHKEDFKKTIKVKIPSVKEPVDSTVSDSAAKTDKSDSLKNVKSDTSEFKDSVIYRSVNLVKREIVEKLFLAENHPDSAYFVKYASQYTSTVDTSDSAKTQAVDTSLVEQKWVEEIRRNAANFFLKKLFKKQYEKEYPDSISEIYGKDKIITPSDLEVILGWLPESRRKSYDAPEKQRYLIEWLLKWELFYNEAVNSGFIKKEDIKAMCDWVWKFEVVKYYVNIVFVDKVEKNINVDTSMCLYKYWDRTGKPGKTPDSSSLADIINSVVKSKTQMVVDSSIYAVRKQKRVTFLQSDHTDDKVEDPEKLAAEADSLYGDGKSNDAKKIYKKLVDNFPFTKEGQNAFIELSKILTEKEKYRDAVKNYRRFLMFSWDKEKQCNIFFMIGFVYGEYLSKPELAEVNYKWILKNKPECELADDAEFMLLHLNEPMIDVEELQAEAKRQGKIEDNEEGQEPSS